MVLGVVGTIRHTNVALGGLGFATALELVKGVWALLI